MEIHAPHAPIHTFKDFLIALGTITAGVLIALSLEGALEWNHTRTLVVEARSTIEREIADNLRDLEQTLQDLERQKADLESALRFADDLLAAGKTDLRQLNVGAALADLSTASWETAERTGALAHMEYDEVRRFARVYTFQELYAEQQRKAIDQAAAAMALFRSGVEPTRWPRDDAALFRQQILALGADVTMQEQLGRRLVEYYRETMKP